VYHPSFWGFLMKRTVKVGDVVEYKAPVGTDWTKVTGYVEKVKEHNTISVRLFRPPAGFRNPKTVHIYVVKVLTK